MTRSELAEIVEEWRQMLLPEWRVVIKDRPFDDESDDDVWASCQACEDYRELRVHFTDACLRRPREQVEITVVHELLHALTRPWRQQVMSMSSDLASDVYRRLEDARRHEEEQLVDRLSRVLVSERRGDDLAYGTTTGA